MSTTDSTQTTRNPLKELTGFQRDLYFAIVHLGGKQSGQEIKQHLEQSGYDEINGGQLYPNLDTLMDKDLVEKGELDRRTNYYALTQSAESKLEQYREFVGE